MATVMGVPQTDADNNGVGTLPWTVNTGLTSFAYADDSFVDTAQINAGSGQTHYLFQTNYTNFSTIPEGATINSITLDLTRFYSGMAVGSVKDAVIDLIVGGVVVGSNKADTITAWPITDGVAQYVWNTNLPTRDQVASSAFGIAISATLNKTGGSGYIIADVDYAPVTIDYTPASTFKPITIFF